MNKFTIVLLICTLCFLTACAPIKAPTTNQYKLAAFSGKPLTHKATDHSILVTLPDAVAGYQTEQMLYIKKPFELTAFAHNAWVNPPAEMLFPLIIQSLQRSGYFYAVTSSPYSEKAEYRLDTQLIALHQNFLRNPSVIDLVVKVVLTHVSDTRVIASRLMSLQTKCPMATPYGGVIAANQTTVRFTAELTHFIITQIKQHH